jgi:hypothetical protein
MVGFHGRGGGLATEGCGHHEEGDRLVGRRDLHRGALFTVEAAEKAWELGALDPLLGSAVRRQLTVSCDLSDATETETQVAESVAAMSRVAVDYSELRQSLLRDNGRTEVEPPWRALRNGAIAVRLRRRLRHHEALVLTRDSRASAAQEQQWTFSVLDRPADPDSRATDFAVTLHRRSGNADESLYRADGPRELKESEDLAQQMLYGFSSLGLSLDPNVGRECPGVGQRGKTVFLEPSDEWHVQCHVCGVKWAGGSDVLSEHEDRRYGFW